MLIFVIIIYIICSHDYATYTLNNSGLYHQITDLDETDMVGCLIQVN